METYVYKRMSGCWEKILTNENENEKLIAGFQRKIKIERRTETIVEGVKSCKSSNDVRK